MTHKILFIQISETDFDESIFISRMLNQLTGEVLPMALVNGISSSLVSSNPDIVVGVLTENQDDNQKRLQLLVESSQPDAIVLLDLYKYFYNPMELNFLPIWLEAYQVPLLALDYYNLLEAHENQIQLSPQVVLPQFEHGEAPEPLQLPIQLIKPVPPVPLDESAERTFYWNPCDPTLRAVAPQLRQQVLDSLGAKSETRIITLFFDPVMFTQALDHTLLGYYFMLIEVMIYYMRQFGGQKFQLLIVGSAPPTDEVNEIPDKNFDVHYFSHMTEDNFKALIAASDLLVSNTSWSPALIDAATLGIPACVFGNSIIQEWKDATESEKELKSFFSPAPPLFQLCEIMVFLNKWSVSLPIFQFINYPQPYTDPDFPNPGLQPTGLPYFLMDMFDDETCLPILQNMLFSQSQQQEYRDYCQEWIKVSEKGLSFLQILEKVKPVTAA